MTTRIRSRGYQYLAKVAQNIIQKYRIGGRNKEKIMEIDPKQLKQLIKDAVKEALSEIPSPTSSEGEDMGKDSNKKTLLYKEVFHRIMEQVARGDIDEATAGKLIADAQRAFDDPSESEESPSPKQGSSTKPRQPLIDQLASWEQELHAYTGKAAETTLEMMERMRKKLEQEAREADFYRASQELDREAVESKAAKDLKEMKDRLSKEK